MKEPLVYRVTHFSEPVHARPELKETVPPHADLLRYDLAFANPAEPSLVVFPIFATNKEGRTSDKITIARWDSYCMKVMPLLHADTLGELPDRFNMPNVHEWITYRRAPGNDMSPLEPCTLAEFLRGEPKMKIVGWR